MSNTVNSTDVLNSILVDNNKLSLSPILTALEAGFDWMNKRFYDGELRRPVIVMAEGHKARAMGWFTYYKPWHLRDSEFAACELMVATDYLDRGFEHVVEMLAHEMVHCYNYQHDIKDCSRSGFRHNKKFKDSAEQHGMVWNPPTEDESSQADYKRVGYARVSFKEDVKDEVYEALSALKDALVLYRDKRQKKDRAARSKSGVIKYMCPCCGNSVRATKEVRIMCMECNELMEAQL